MSPDLVDSQYSFRGDCLAPPISIVLAGKNLRREAFIRIAVALALMLATSTIEGNRGSLGSFDPWVDVQRVFRDDITRSEPSFPFLRDYPSILLAILAMLTLVVIPWQWRLLRAAMPDAIRQGAITPVIANGCDLLVAHTKKINDQMRRFSSRPYHAFYLVVATALTSSIVVGSRRSGRLFEVLVPGDLVGAARQQWLNDTYHSWWASLDHPLGVTVYFTLMVITFYAVIVQNIGGYFAIGYIWGLKKNAVMREREIAPDGRAGWQGMARAYRTVYFSLSIHGVAIAVIVLAMGVEATWVSGTVLIYLSAFLSYIFLPRFVFRSAILTDRSRRALSLAEKASKIEQSGPLQLQDIQNVAWLRDEIMRLDKQPIVPLATTTARLVTISITVVTVALAVLQTVASF